MTSRLPILIAAMLAVILIPFFLFEDSINTWFAVLTKSGHNSVVLALVFGGLLASDIVLPVPSSLVSTACGIFLGFWPGFLTSWLGMTGGCLLGYWLGTRFPAERFLTPKDIERLETTKSKFGDWLLVVFRAVPVLAEASVFFAGLTRIPLGRFLLLTTLSNLGVSLAYAATGAYAADRDTFLYAFFGAIGIPAVAILATRRR